MTVKPREELPTVRGRQTQAAIDAAARRVIARKGFPPTTVSDIATEAGRSAGSFYNYYDSKESTVREWVQRFIADAKASVRAADEPDLTNRERAHRAAATYWDTYRAKLPEIISVSELAMVENAQKDGYCQGDDPKITALALVSMLNQFCYHQFSGNSRADAVDDAACITMLANVFYRTIYHKEGGPS